MCSQWLAKTAVCNLPRLRYRSPNAGAPSNGYRKRTHRLLRDGTQRTQAANSRLNLWPLVHYRRTTRSYHSVLPLALTTRPYHSDCYSSGRLRARLASQQPVERQLSFLMLHLIVIFTLAKLHVMCFGRGVHCGIRRIYIVNCSLGLPGCEDPCHPMRGSTAIQRYHPMELPGMPVASVPTSGGSLGTLALRPTGALPRLASTRLTLTTGSLHTGSYQDWRLPRLRPTGIRTLACTHP